MNNPYQILDVSPTDSDEDIKKAYRKLCRKYHPDLNTNAPNLDELEQKFRDIQAAYQQIMDERSGNAGAGYGSYSDFGGYRSASANTNDENEMHKRAAVNFIQNARFAEALNVLDSMSERDAQWYYIHAFANNGLRNTAAALQDAQTAARMEPSNLQYQQLVQRLSSNAYSYQNMQSSYMPSGSSMTSDCIRCCAANLICNILTSCCCRCG